MAEENSSSPKRRKQNQVNNKDLASFDILESQKRRSENQLSPRDEDIKKVEDQKLNNESFDKEKNHFALVVEKGCNYLS